MFFRERKLQRRVDELGQKRYFGHQCIAPFTSMGGNYKNSYEKVFHSVS